MLEDWTAEVVGRMHKAGVTGKQLAEKAGITNAYLSTVLNGHKGNEDTQRRIFAALQELEAQAASADGEAPR